MILRETVKFALLVGVLLVMGFAGVGISYVYDMLHGAHICMEVQRGVT